jgi:lipoate-protein ligase A
LPVFGFVALHAEPLADGPAAEAQWLQRVAGSGRAAAHLWQGRSALVLPRSYMQSPGWAEATAASAQAGWPVQLRASGGGLVPQGPGVLNLSLMWPAHSARPVDSEAVYQGLCAELAAAFARLGLVATAQAVSGSFCDGRYNLAVGGAKLVGTAQSWRRVAGVPTVLAHAVLLVDADPVALTARCNTLEVALGRAARYRPEAITSVAQAWQRAHPGAALPLGFAAGVARVLAEQFARVLPPGGVSAPSGTPTSAAS